MIPADELLRRQDAVRAALIERGWSCAVVSSEQNFAYLTGLRFDALASSAARSLVCVVPTDGPLQLIIPSFLRLEAAGSIPQAVITAYDPPRQPVDESLVLVLANLGFGPIGWEMGPESRMGLPFDSVDSVRRAIGRHDLEDVSGVLWEIRMRKSPSEIAAIAAASRAGSLAFEAVFAQGVTGRSEREIARALARYALEGGADRAEWVVCTSGAGSYHRFVSAPRDRRVEAGDLFWADIGLTCSGYWTDFCRAAVAGPVSQQRSSLQRSVVAATAVGVDMCRPGTPVREVAAAIRQRMTELGLDALDYGRLGHGIGLSSTEPPSIAEWDPTILATGMVVTIEPAVTGPSGLFCAEQVVVVTEGEPEVLTSAPSYLTEA